MPKVTFILPDQSEKQVEVSEGTSLMQAALNNRIHSIVGDCGGSVSCATCHVYVDQQFVGRVAPMDPSEDQMLEATASERLENSRLSCQIFMSDELDGIVVRVADKQW